MKKLKSCTRSLYHIVPYRFCFLLIFCTNQVSVDNRGGKKSSPLTQKLLLKNKKKSFCIDTQWMTLIYDTSQTRVVCIWACIDKGTPAAEFWRSIQYDMRGFTYKTNVGWRMPRKQMNAQIVLYKHINRIPHTMCQSLHRIIYIFSNLHIP